MPKGQEQTRCGWANTPLSIAYHDDEWGRPVHDDRVLFEFITLEGAQAGLSWETILKKRDAYRQAFADFDPAKVARFTAARPTVLAVVPAGYADGLDRRLEGHGVVIIRGQRAPIVGAVSMDMLTVDVTDVPGVGPGDEVIFLGRGGEQGWQSIDAREMAAWTGTIPYEVLCRLGARVERQYR